MRLRIDADHDFLNCWAMAFARNSGLNDAEIAATLAATGRVQINDFLEPSGTEALLAHLTEADRWIHVLNSADKVYEIACDVLATMDDANRAILRRKTDEEAARGFQFHFDTIRVPDSRQERIAASNLLADFALFISSPPIVRWFRKITGCPGIDFADCQATRYRNGDFLTRHDDAVEGKHRQFAYVLGLTQEWRAEWGGLLIFPQDEATSVETLVPRFNVLSLFKIGQQHSVSQVASYAPLPRISVTGWLRSSD